MGFSRVSNRFSFVLRNNCIFFDLLNSRISCRQIQISLWLLLACLFFSSVTIGQTEELAVSNFEVEGLSGWIPKVFKGKTDYQLAKENGRIVVRATSKAAASGLVKKIKFNPLKYRYLRWSWKVENTITDGDAKTKAGDDYAARLYIVFPGYFFWQTKAINYIWANKLPKGDTIPNPYTDHAMMVAVESGPSFAGRWLDEQRDILSDYKHLFGELPKEASAIAIMTDTDNTGESVVAWYGDIILSTSPK
jgi:hypothetical protein